MFTIEVVTRCEIIEDYPEDARGDRSLLGFDVAAGRPVHVDCSPKPDFLAIITAYTPAPAEWEAAFQLRRQP